MQANDPMSLLDWRRRTAELYQAVRAHGDAEAACALWRRVRDEMFASHPQSPIPAAERAAFRGLAYYDYDLAHRVSAVMQPLEPKHYEIGTSGSEPMSFERVGALGFELGGRALQLEAYWLTGYGGGLFVPFRDATSVQATYGGGRYLLDTIKGADLGMTGNELVLDFNFAYNPSCSYDPRWVCPLAPPPNRIEAAIEAGERIRI